MEMLILSLRDYSVPLEELSESKISGTNEESGCGIKDEDVPEEGTLANKKKKILTLKKLSEVFHDIESTKDSQ